MRVRSIVFVSLFTAPLVVWSRGTALLWHDTRRTSDALAWVAGRGCEAGMATM
ncbi:hypothetical protein MNO14_13615 [Luteimonas sp. S4-F44]|uniref:hypothetical protein n=1 Tax=Luteimonas sp. S4-F44 TaxID=2925842 RepID=UPI001F52F41A|nr:hypothetical protein [Luteimonas sp. S4-F44]UNK41977.1 hypothetical protein MNO14_13615 [Luteimonas sp. S4-F44]